MNKLALSFNYGYSPDFPIFVAGNLSPQYTNLEINLTFRSICFIIRPVSLLFLLNCDK